MDKLVVDFSEARKKAGVKGNLSDHLDWRKTHVNGTSLWKKLISRSLKNIQIDAKGNSNLFNFLNAATEFEDLLYGLDIYYRDHTLHSLWVYFLGEHILRDHLSNIHNNLNWYLYNDIVDNKSEYSQGIIRRSEQKEKELCKKVNEHRDAVWCIMALCHDLGYSLEKLDKLNDKVKAVLGFFDLPHFRQIGYSLDLEHQYNVDRFLELMAIDIRIIPQEDLKDVLVKGFRDDSTYWRLCRALEKKQHGILSAYLIYKTLSIFAEVYVRGPAEYWGLEDDEAIVNIIRGDILFAITQHEFDFAYLDELSSLADILILADELEEFSRYGRQLQSRQYYDTTAEVSVSFKPANVKQGQDVEIYITYEVAEHLKEKDDLFRFYIKKAEKLYKLYSLNPDHRTGSKSKIKYIKVIIEGAIPLTFEICSNINFKAQLPAAKIKDESYKSAKYDLISEDDELLVVTKKKKTSLEEWLKHADVK